MQRKNTCTSVVDLLGSGEEDDEIDLIDDGSGDSGLSDGSGGSSPRPVPVIPSAASGMAAELVAMFDVPLPLAEYALAK